MFRKVFFGVLAIAIGCATIVDAGGRPRSARSDEAVTLWGVIFNAPEACSGGVCDEDDVVDPGPAETAVVFMGGGSVPPNGKVSLAGRYAENTTLGALPFPTLSLYDADAAEVHLVLRTHGRMIAGVADDQVMTFDGGCDLQLCEDVQFAVFRPAEAAADGKQTSLIYSFATGEPIPGAWATLWREADGIRASVHARLP